MPTSSSYFEQTDLLGLATTAMETAQVSAAAATNQVVSATLAANTATAAALAASAAATTAQTAATSFSATPATTTTRGLIKPDGTTVITSGDGTLSVNPTLIATLKATIGTGGTTTVTTVIKVDGTTITKAGDDTLSVVGVNIRDLPTLGAYTGNEMLVLDNGVGNAKSTVTALKSWVTANLSAGSNSSAPMATSSVAGIVKPGSDFTVSNDGTLSINATTTHALAAGSGIVSTDEIDLFNVSSGNSVKYTMSQIAAYVASVIGTGNTGNTGGTTPTYASSFSVSAPSTGTVGTPLTLTITPGSGGWNNSTVTPTYSGVAGNYDAANKVGTGTTPVTFAFTPSAAGTASLNALVSGLTSNGPATVTVSAAAQSGGTTTPSGSYPALALSNAAYGTGKFGQALTGGTGVATYTVAENGNGNGQASVYIAAWVKIASTSNNVEFLVASLGSGSNLGSFTVGVGNDNCVFFRINGDYRYPGTAYVLADGNWHFVVLSLESNYNYMYPHVAIDGNIIWGDGQALQPIFLAGSNTFRIDMSSAPAGSAIDDVRVLSAPLSSLAAPTSAATRDGNTIVIYSLDGSGTGS